MARITVSFKDEDEIDGVAVGPVVVTDLDLYEQDPKVRDSGGLIPYGYTPQGVTKLGWLSLPEALEVARSHGVDLIRS